MLFLFIFSEPSVGQLAPLPRIGELEFTDEQQSIKHQWTVNEASMDFLEDVARSRSLSEAKSFAHLASMKLRDRQENLLIALHTDWGVVRNMQRQQQFNALPPEKRRSVQAVMRFRSQRGGYSGGRGGYQSASLPFRGRGGGRGGQQPSRGPGNQQFLVERLCYGCNKTGHHIRDCPNPWRAHYMPTRTGRQGSSTSDAGPSTA
jgi:hypothetical protein